MGHELEIMPDGTAAAMFAREDPWHRLGITLPDCFTWKDAADRAYLGGRNVRLIPMTATEITDDGVTTIEVPDQFATVQTNPQSGAVELLSTAGKRYVPIQFEEVGEMMDTLVDMVDGAHYETAGALRGGRETFLSMRMPDTMTVGGHDPVDAYIVALNSHAGRSLVLLVSMVRVVCANTQAAALRDHRSMFKIRHTAGAKGRIEEARQALGLSWQYMDAFEDEAAAMLDTAMTDGQFMDIVRTQLAPIEDDATDRVRRNTEETHGQLLSYWHGAANANIAGTAWAGYQSVTEWVDHSIPVQTPKGADEQDYRSLRVLTDPTLDGIKFHAFDQFRVLTDA